MGKGLILRSRPFTVTALTLLQAGAPAANAANDFAGMVARAATPGIALRLRIDLGPTPPPIDTFAALNVVGAADTVGAILQGGNDPTFASWDVQAVVDPSATELATAQGRYQILHLFSTPQTWRYWLLSLTPLGGLQMEVARLLIGSRFQPGRNFSFGVGRGVSDLGGVEFAPRGAFLRRNAARRRTLGLAWQYLTELEAEQQGLPLLEAVGTTECVLVSLDPDPDPERSRRIYFGPLQGSLGLSWRARDRWEKRLQLVSLI